MFHLGCPVRPGSIQCTPVSGFIAANCQQKMLDRSYEIYLNHLNREARKEALTA